MPTLTGFDSGSGIEQLDRLSDSLQRPGDILGKVADAVIFPMLARNYVASGLKQRSGRLFNGITKRGAPGNYVRESPGEITVGVSYEQIPYAQSILEGAQAHDIPNAFGRGPRFGIGGRFNGKFHPGNKKYRVYYWTAEDMNMAQEELRRLMMERRN